MVNISNFTLSMTEIEKKEAEYRRLMHITQGSSIEQMSSLTGFSTAISEFKKQQNVHQEFMQNKIRSLEPMVSLATLASVQSFVSEYEKQQNMYQELMNSHISSLRSMASLAALTPVQSFVSEYEKQQNMHQVLMNSRMSSLESMPLLTGFASAQSVISRYEKEQKRYKKLMENGTLGLMSRTSFESLKTAITVLKEKSMLYQYNIATCKLDTLDLISSAAMLSHGVFDENIEYMHKIDAISQKYLIGATQEEALEQITHDVCVEEDNKFWGFIFNYVKNLTPDAKAHFFAFIVQLLLALLDSSSIQITYSPTIINNSIYNNMNKEIKDNDGSSNILKTPFEKGNKEKLIQL